MSGNYDYPPASRRSTRTTSDSQERLVRPNAVRLQHLRDLLGTERHRGNNTTARALETLDREIEAFRSERRGDRTDFEQARAALDRQMQHLQTDLPSREERNRRVVAGHPSRSTTTVTAANPAAVNHDPTLSDWFVPPSRSPRRRSLRQYMTNSRASAIAPHNFPRIASHGRPREPTSSHHLLDDPIPRLENPSFIPHEMDNDQDLDRWRAKRRKLESDDTREGLRGFSYGQYGQVVPGPLRMEIESCDGGNYEAGGRSSWPENVLRNDNTVYCTKSDRCNLILRHLGETPFCLKKIVIKAPRSGFDSPIKEGMIFVSMSSDELLARTAQYQIQYPHSRRRRRRRRTTAVPPSQAWLESHRSPLRSLERTVLAGPDAPSDSDDIPLSEAVAENNVSHATDFRVTTDYDARSETGSGVDYGNDEDEYPSATETERIGDDHEDDDLFCPESGGEENESGDDIEDDEDEEDDDNDVNNDEDDDDDDSNDEDDRTQPPRATAATSATTATNPNRLQRAQPLSRIPLTSAWGHFHNSRPPRRTGPGPNELAPASSISTVPASVIRMDAPSPPPPSGVLKPHARFFIEGKKSMVSVRFDPPPSGRFILIKLWSPHSGGNIDIQSIITHGFAGPRFFPAGTFR